MRLIVKGNTDLLLGQAPVEGFPVKLASAWLGEEGIILVRPPSDSRRTRWHLARSADLTWSTFEGCSSLCGVEEPWDVPEMMWEHSISGYGPGVSLCDACVRKGKLLAPAEVEP